MTLQKRALFLLHFEKCDLDICRWRMGNRTWSCAIQLLLMDLWCYVPALRSILLFLKYVFQVANEKQKLMAQVAHNSLDGKESGRCEFNAQPIQGKVFLYLLGSGTSFPAASPAVRQAMVWLANVWYSTPAPKPKQPPLHIPSQPHPIHSLYQEEPRRWRWGTILKNGKSS